MLQLVGITMLAAPSYSGPPPAPTAPPLHSSSSSSSYAIVWPPPSVLHSCISGGLLGLLLLAAGTVLYRNGYHSLGRISRRYGMSPAELLAVLQRHAHTHEPEP